MAIELAQENFTLPGQEEEPSSERAGRVKDFEYELKESDSLTFLYNLIYDKEAKLSNNDILNILNSLKNRDNHLPFSFSPTDLKNRNIDHQGINWNGKKTAFLMDRMRKRQTYTNISGSKMLAINDRNMIVHNTLDSFEFRNFYAKTKPQLIHFQLRNLVSSTNKNGIFYCESVPSSLSHNDTVSKFLIKKLNPEFNEVETIIDSSNLFCPYDRVSSLTCSDNALVVGTFEGSYIYQNLTTKEYSEKSITMNPEGITNHISINERMDEIIFCSNDKYLRSIDSRNFKLKNQQLFPFALNCLSVNPKNPFEKLIVCDYIDSYIIDTRSTSSKIVASLKGHYDYGFSCAWFDDFLVTGNQDSTLRLWDRRNLSKSIAVWEGNNGGAIRNVAISDSGKYLSWGESLDNVGIIDLKTLTNTFVNPNHNDLPGNSNGNPKELAGQSIDLIGKIAGLNFVESDNNNGEKLIIGINDSTIGGILSYEVESSSKCLDFDFF